MGEWLNSLKLRVRMLWRRQQLERDLNDELSFHLAMRERTLRGSGDTQPAMSTRVRFGNVVAVREDLREVWRIAPRAGAFARDLRYAARALSHAPTFALVVVLTLGLGIGTNTAFFTVVNAVLLRPLGYVEADQLVSLHESFSRGQNFRLPFSSLDFDDFRNYQQSFAGAAAYRNVAFEVSGHGVPERLFGAKASADLFNVLGVSPGIGRTFTPEEDRPGANVALLSWGLWQRRYGGSPTIVGQTITLDRVAHTVIGVMPEGFAFPRRGLAFNGEPADVWVPIAFTPRERVERGNMHMNNVVARLRPGITLDTARADLDLVSERIAANYPAGLRNAGFEPFLLAQPFRDEISGRLEKPLVMLMAAVGLVLLVACANVANLFLSRLAARSREFAVRTALGARRTQVVQLLLAEALLLSFAAGAVGIAIAYWAVRAAPAVLTRTVPGLHDLVIDWRVLAFTAAVSTATAVIFGLLPLPLLDRRDPVDSLRDDPSRTSGGGKVRVQRALVVLTVSLACVLLAGAGLFIRSFVSLVTTDLGFRPGHVLTASMTLPRTFYATATSVRTFQDSLVNRLSALPGVRGVSVATDLPLGYADTRVFTPEGSTMPEGARPATNLSWVNGAYFETLGMTLQRGRFFTPDEHAEIRRVVVVNEKLAALAWPGQDPVGKRLKWGIAQSQAPWLTVVGVIADVTDGPIGTEPGVHAYEPFRQFPDAFLNGAPTSFGRDLKAAILTETDPRALGAIVRQELSTLDPQLAVETIQTMEAQVSEVLAPQRFSAGLVAAFAAIALLLAAVGLYGVLAFATVQRSKEIAVRMALGAARASVLRMVIGQGARLVLIGLLAGLAAALGVTRIVSSLLYQTSPYDAVAFLVVPLVLTPVALLASALPAWRASRVDPSRVLRAD